MIVCSSIILTKAVMCGAFLYKKKIDVKTILLLNFSVLKLKVCSVIIKVMFILIVVFLG